MGTATKENCIKAIEDVVNSILTDIGVPTSIGSESVPHKIAEFDSPIALLGTSMVAGVTGISVPLDENIFVEQKNKQIHLRTIEQAAERLMELQSQQNRRERRKDVGVAS